MMRYVVSFTILSSVSFVRLTPVLASTFLSLQHNSSNKFQ